MTTRGPLDDDAPFDAIALVEAHIRGDGRAMEVITENCHLRSVVSMLTIYLSRRLTEPDDHRPAQVWLEGMRGVFAEAFWDVPA